MRWWPFARTKRIDPVDSRRGWREIISEPFSGAWQQDIEWRRQTVLAHHAVYACISLIAADIAKLYPHLVRLDEDHIWRKVDESPFARVLSRPNRYQNRQQFIEWWIASKLIRGNAYILKERDGRGMVRALYVLDPDRVEPLVADDGDVFYRLRSDNLSGIARDDVTYPASEIIHDRMNCLHHPLVGTSPIFASGASAAASLMIQKDQHRFFANSAKPGGMLTAPGPMSDETAARLKKHFEENYTGANAGKVAVAGDGLKYEPMRMTAVDAQLVEQLGWTAKVICSVFHVPAYMIGMDDAPSYNNIEALNQQYYSQCLQALIEAWELCMTEGQDLPSRTRVQLDLDGLLRMDTATQYKTLGDGLKSGMVAPNEGRAKINLPPVPGGEYPYLQQQNYSLEALSRRGDGPDVSEAIRSVIRTLEAENE